MKNDQTFENQISKTEASLIMQKSGWNIFESIYFATAEKSAKVFIHRL